MNENPPRGHDLEALIADVWRNVLGVSAVSPDDDFLTLGGNSLHAVRIVSQVEDELDLTLSVRSLLEARTVRLMAHQVRQALTAAEQDRDEAETQTEGRAQ